MSGMLTPIQQTLTDYWMSMPRRTHHLIPCKSDLYLPKLYKIAPHLGIAEDYSEDSVRVRLMGSATDELLSENITHQNTLDHYDNDSRDWAKQLFRNMFDTPCGYSNDFFFNFKQRPIYKQKTFHLPLADEDGKTKFLISTFEQDEVYFDLKDTTPGLVNIRDLTNNKSIDVGAGPGNPPFPLLLNGQEMVMHLADIFEES